MYILKYHCTSKTVPVLLSLIFPFHLIPSPIHSTGVYFCFFPSFLAIFISLSSPEDLPPPDAATAAWRRPEEERTGTVHQLKDRDHG